MSSPDPAKRGRLSTKALSLSTTSHKRARQLGKGISSHVCLGEPPAYGAIPKALVRVCVVCVSAIRVFLYDPWMHDANPFGACGCHTLSGYMALLSAELVILGIRELDPPMLWMRICLFFFACRFRTSPPHLLMRTICARVRWNRRHNHYSNYRRCDCQWSRDMISRSLDVWHEAALY